MSSNAAFVENWNEIILYKIKESDLAKPTEHFLTNALMNYLHNFNFDLSRMISLSINENSNTRKKFHFELCSYIDYLYKLNKETTHSFTYYDLVNPTSKKTIHLLNYLLNYLFFFNLMKKEILHESDEKIAERSLLAKKKDDLGVEVEKKKCLADEIKNKLEEFEKVLPKLNEKFEMLTAKVQESMQKKESLEIVMENYDSRLIALKREETVAQSNVVSEEEVESITNKITELKKLLKEKSDIQRDVEAANRDRSVSIQQLQDILGKLESIMDIMKLEDIQKKKEVLEAYKECCREFEEQEKTTDKLKNTIHEQNQRKDNLEKTIAETEQAYQKMRQHLENECSEKEKLLKEAQKTNESLDSQLHDIEDSIMKQEEITDIIQNTIARIFKHLSKRYS